MAEATGDDALRYAVRLSEQTKDVVRSAFHLKLEALNACVLTHTREVRAPGFECVAEQMGALARALTDAMHEITAINREWIFAASFHLRSERRGRVWAEVARGRAPSAGAAVRSAEERTSRSADEVAAVQRKFAACVEDIGQLSTTGFALSRMARLEAAYGCERRDDLTKVADAFTALVDHIHVTIHDLQASIRMRRPRKAKR